ncbi:hypothetical protein ACO1D4_16015 [Bacillus velezensis]|uniref:hypothetical protein n=1 Tax=Bacillus velezensis TaxID=492670 RepID=UPI003BF4BC49
MTGNRFVDWCNENNLNSEDETFLVQLSGAFCNYENDKAKEMNKQLFINRYGEELGISSIKGVIDQNMKKLFVLMKRIITSRKKLI